MCAASRGPDGRVYGSPDGLGRLAEAQAVVLAQEGDGVATAPTSAAPPVRAIGRGPAAETIVTATPGAGAGVLAAVAPSHLLERRVAFEQR
jgi:hypothetical protein